MADEMKDVRAEALQMSRDLVGMIDAQDGESSAWQALYERAADDGNDFLTEVRSAVDYGLSDPEDTVQMACAAAETAEAAVQALNHEWALYTPQQAATVASALFAQLEATAEALRTLRQAIGHVADRGEMKIPAPSHGEQALNAGDALESLLNMSEEIDCLVSRYASHTVKSLDAAAGTATLPTDAHETISAVAALLIEQLPGQVTFDQRHEAGEYDPDDDHGFGCGCSITIVADGETYDVSHGDSEWAVIRQSDGRKNSDGTITFTNWAKLSTSLDAAHPQQLANDVLRIITP